MTRRMMGMVTGMLVLALAGCADGPSAPVPVDAERADLVQRTQDLAARVTTAGRMSEDDRATLAALARDVDVWQTETGQGPARVAGTGGLQGAISYSRASGGTCGGVCVPVVVMGDLICFIAATPCIGGVKKCQYSCFVNLDRLPVLRA